MQESFWICGGRHGTSTDAKPCFKYWSFSSRYKGVICDKCGMEVREYFFASPTIYKADFLHILKEKLWCMRELALNENGRLYFGEYKQGFNSALEKAQELIDKEF